MNSAGEVIGSGPEWACESYAKPGHHYITCIHCRANFIARFGPLEAV